MIDTPNVPNDAEVKDAVVVSGGSAAESAVDILLNIENLIKNHVASIEKLKVEAKKHAEMVEDAFENDATYKQHSEDAKKVNKIKNQTKSQIMKQTSVAGTVEKIKDMKQQIRELSGALSDYLKEYARLSGSMEIADEQGNVYDIQYMAKLVKQKTKQ
jgi:seryl-tRNA synthetase